jgi:tetratricopeptide (TPR) repeat protein
MFEVLLQAEKALASGALDQAERSYWQLIVLDPTNAIAVAGLARVSLDRGDERLARTFAERALAIDPESFAAKQIIEILEGRWIKPPASDEPDLPLLAAQRLEALGRRRATGRATGHRATDHAGADTHASAPTPAAVPSSASVPASAPASVPAALPASASAPAPRPQAPRGAKAHQALGDRARRHRLPETLKPRPRPEDPFAAAESAAAVEAVEAVDEAGDVVLAHPFEPAEGGAQIDELSQVLGAVGATDEDESIALRVALVADAAQLDAAELDAAMDTAELQAADLWVAERRELELNEAEMEAAEAMAAEAMAAISIGPTPSRRIDIVALEADLWAAELRVAHEEPVEPEAAQAEQAEQATPAIEEVGAVEPIELIEPVESIAPAQEATEEDAEAAALREALAVVLGGDTGDAPTENEEPAPHGVETAAAQPSADHDNELPAEGSDHGGDTAGPKAMPQRHRKGLLRRLLGG